MSKDIRSFFSMGSKAKKPDPSKESSSSGSSKRKVIIDSDEEQEDRKKTIPTPERSSSSYHKKRRVIDSDDEDKKKSPAKSKTSSSSNSSSSKPDLSKLKVVNAADVFSSAPVKRKEVPKPTKKAIKEEIEIHSDEEFEKTLLGLEEFVPETPDQKKRSAKDSPTKKKEEERKVEKESPAKTKERTPKESPIKRKESANGHDRGEEKRKEEKKKKTPEKSKEKSMNHESTSDSAATPKSVKKSSNESKPVKQEVTSDDGGTPKSTKKSANESILTDEERYERKRMSAALYQKFKNRQGPANPGSKEIPKGKPNCLAGLQFVVTGVLESMERDECAQIIKDFGGKVVGSVSKKLTHIVVGEDAGPAKLAKAEELGIPQISEDDLLDLIREKSGLPKKGSGTSSSSSSKEEKSTHKQEEESPSSDSKDKKRKKTDVDSVTKKSKATLEKKRTPEKRPTLEFSSPVAKLPKIPKIEKVSSETKSIKIEKTTPEKKSPKKSLAVEPTAPIKREVTTYQKDISSTENMAWVDKYKPTSVKQIIGQSGPASNVQKLMNWLSKWHSNHDGKKKLTRPSPWAKNDDGAYFKAALLSGPPGVGKTTTATLVCKELGFDAVEFNASDTRSKKLLKEEVSELLNNKSLFGYFTEGGKGEKVSKKHVLIMDEVDGMAGNEDRGGIQELIALIKDSHVPIICMCNDRNHQKMRSLVNYCYDLRFNKPRVEQIKGAMMSVCFKEGLKLAPGALEEIIAGTGGDVRQTLNHLALYSAGKATGAGNLSVDQAKKEAEIARKDVKMGPWDVVRKVFSAEEHKTMSIHDKSDLFFHDYSLAPLFVQENYLKVAPRVPKGQVMERVALAADSLSRGDMVDRRIRSNMAWSLLPLQAMYSSVMPGEYMEGNFTGQINFPGWLGKNSKASKRKRLAQEIHDHTRIRTSGSRLSVRLDYAPFLVNAIVRPLKEKGSDGVAEALNVIKEYRLLREDLESLIELTTWPKKKSPMDEVDGKVKAALTRAYNKEIAPYSYSAINTVKKKRAEAEVDEAGELYEAEGEESAQAVDSDEEKEDDDLENNAFIKVKKKPASKGSGEAGSAGGNKAGGSKGKSSASGKGKKK